MCLLYPAVDVEAFLRFPLGWWVVVRYRRCRFVVYSSGHAWVEEETRGKQNSCHPPGRAEARSHVSTRACFVHIFAECFDRQLPRGNTLISTHVCFVHIFAECIDRQLPRGNYSWLTCGDATRASSVHTQTCSTILATNKWHDERCTASQRVLAVASSSPLLRENSLCYIPTTLREG